MEMNKPVEKGGWWLLIIDPKIETIFIQRIKYCLEVTLQ